MLILTFAQNFSVQTTLFCCFSLFDRKKKHKGTLAINQNVLTPMSLQPYIYMMYIFDIIIQGVPINMGIQ